MSLLAYHKFTMKYLLLKLCFKNKCPHLLYITELQQINNYNIYNTIVIQNHKNYENIFSLFSTEGLFIQPFCL